MTPLDCASPASRPPSGALKALLGVAAAGLIAGVIPAGAQAQFGGHSPVVWTQESLPYTGKVTTSHGYSVLGSLKYPAGFRRYDYVNPQAPKGGTFRATTVGTFDTLNYMIVIGTAPTLLRLASPERETIMGRSGDEQGSQYGLIAETVTYPEDLSWVEYKLRPEARWHDGVPITVKDILFSVDFLMTKGHPAFRFRYPSLKKVVQTGPRSVRFIFSEKNNRTVVLNAGDTPVLPWHYYQTHDITKQTLEPPLGSGAYKVVAVDPGRSMTFARVKDYWGRNLPINVGRFNFDTYRLDFYRDQAAEFEAFMAGASDFRGLGNTPPGWKTGYDRPAVRKGWIKRDEIVSQNAGAYQGLYLNLRRDKFKDPKVREALAYVLDFGFVNRVIFYGMYSRTRSYFPKSRYEAAGLPTKREIELLEPYRSELDPRVFTTEYNPPAMDGSWKSRRENLVKAHELLRQAGYVVRGGRLVNGRTGKPLEIEILLQDPSFQNVFGTVAANFRRLGIKATLRMADSSLYLKRQQQFDYDVIVGLGLPITPAPGAELRSAWVNHNVDRPGSANLMGIKSKAVDDLVERLIVSPDMDEKLAAGRALDRVLTWTFASVPLYRLPTTNIAYWDKFGRPKVEPRYGIWSAPISWWWVDAKKDAALKKMRSS